MCKEVMGIVIADPVKNVRPVHGFCMRCGYGFRWAIISSWASSWKAIERAKSFRLSQTIQPDTRDYCCVPAASGSRYFL